MNCYKSAALALLIAAATACDSDSDLTIPRLPEFFALNAAAQGSDGDLTVDCHVAYLVELNGIAEQAETHHRYFGVMGGEAGRKILRPDGSGLALNGDAHAMIQVTHTFPDNVLIESVGSLQEPPPDNSNFWDNIATLHGKPLADGTIAGAWTCAPFYTEQGGINDNEIHVEGTWLTVELQRQ